MTHPNYFQDEIGGQDFYRCCQCQYDSFSLGNIEGHVKTCHGPLHLPESEYSEAEWVNRCNLGGLRIGLSLLTWNNGDAGLAAANALQQEADRLVKLGVKVWTYLVDNHSSDHWYESVGDMFDHLYVAPENEGQSVARNRIIERAVADELDYLVMLDGDIEIIPWSSQALVGSLIDNSRYGCVGMYSHNCTNQRYRVSPECRSLRGLLVEDAMIAWTQYGAFDCVLFRGNAGLRFDESQCFRGPGWGFEDDDFGLQMHALGKRTACTKMFTYGHYDKHSSLYLLDPEQAKATYEARREYVYRKWCYNSNLEIARYAARLRNQTMKLDKCGEKVVSFT